MADVTVIIPTYNEELNIAECIKSLDGFAKKIIITELCYNVAIFKWR